MTVKKIIISLFLLMLLFDGQAQLKTETEAALLQKDPTETKAHGVLLNTELNMKQDPGV